MICDGLHWDDRGARPLSGAERAHVDGCVPCQAELSRHQAMQALLRGAPSEALGARIREQAHAALEAQPVARARPWPWIGASLLALVASLPGLALHARGDWASVGAGWMAVLAVLLLAFAGAGRVAFAPGLAPRGTVRASMAIALGAGLLLMVRGAGIAPHRSGLLCLIGIVGLSLLPLGLLLGVLRGEGLSASRGAWAGLCAGALGEALFFRHCAVTATTHLVLMHLGAWALLALLGGVLGPRLRKPLWSPGSAD